jgi:hypothetical protein
VQRRQRGFDLRCLGPARIELQVRLERADREIEVAEVERGHSKLVVRQRHLRVGLGRAFKRRLGSRELAAIEQRHALVVERFRVAPAQRIGRRRVLRCQRALLGRQVELPLLVVDEASCVVRLALSALISMAFLNAASASAHCFLFE